MFQPPSQYDSFIVRSENSDLETLIDSDVDISKYSYIIKDRSRILPLYEVEFDYDKDLEERSKGFNTCEMCLSNNSIMFCLAERASFCKSCDLKIHNNEFTMRHKKYYFNQVGDKKFIHCGSHVDTLVDYFCEECCVPLCAQCKISGNHSSPPYSTHKLITYLQACDKLKERIYEEEEEVDEKSKTISEYLQGFKEEVDGFRMMIKNVRNKIDAEYKAAINELNSIVRKRYQIINAEYLEHMKNRSKCIRMKEYVERMDSAQLVKSFKGIQEQKKDICLGELSKFKCEKICLKGFLSLYGDEESDMRKEVYQPRIGKGGELYQK
jgi:hypothetical protein